MVSVKKSKCFKLLLFRAQENLFFLYIFWRKINENKINKNFTAKIEIRMCSSSLNYLVSVLHLQLALQCIDFLTAHKSYNEISVWSVFLCTYICFYPQAMYYLRGDCNMKRHAVGGGVCVFARGVRKRKYIRTAGSTWFRIK